MIDHRKRFDREMIALMTGKPVWQGDDRSYDRQTVSDDQSSGHQINSDERSSDHQNDVDVWAFPDCYVVLFCSLYVGYVLKNLCAQNLFAINL